MKVQFNEASRANLTHSLQMHKGCEDCHIVYMKSSQDFRVIYRFKGEWEPIDKDEVDITALWMEAGNEHDSLRWSQAVELADSIIEAEEEEPSTRFEALRKEHGMSKRQACELCGVPYRTWLKWENGERACPDYVFDLIKFYLENREK